MIGIPLVPLRSFQPTAPLPLPSTPGAPRLRPQQAATRVIETADVLDQERAGRRAVRLAQGRDWRGLMNAYYSRVSDLLVVARGRLWQPGLYPGGQQRPGYCFTTLICQTLHSPLSPPPRCKAVDQVAYVFLTVQGDSPNDITGDRGCNKLFRQRIFYGSNVLVYPRCSIGVLPGCWHSIIIIISQWYNP